MYNYRFDIYINNEVAFNNLTTLETLLQLNYLDSKVNIELLQKYSILKLQNNTTTIEIKRS